MEVFKELAEIAGLLGTKVYSVHDQWVGRKECCSTYPIVRGSAKDLHFFRTVVPLEFHKIRGLWGIHSPEALKWQTGLSFCPWCGKEGQNKGTMVNHLCTGHYHHLLVCHRFLSYFKTMSDKMQHHAQGCPCMPSCKDKGNGEVEKFNSLLDWPSGGCTPCYRQDAMLHHAMLLATPSFGVSSALDYKASENNKNNTTEDVLLAQKLL